MLLDQLYLDAETQYKDSMLVWLRKYQFELLATVSLGVPYVPKDLETKLRQVLKRVTSIPYQCGFYGVYVASATPHVHLLLKSAGEPLDARLVELLLAKAFKRKDMAVKLPKGGDGDAKNLGVISVEREHSPSVDVTKIYEVSGAISYLCQQYPDMHKMTGNEIFGNLKALDKKKLAGPTLGDLTQDMSGDFVWDESQAA